MALPKYKLIGDVYYDLRSYGELGEPALGAGYVWVGPDGHRVPLTDEEEAQLPDN